MLKILIIGCGGFLGAISRYLIDALVANIATTTLFPFGIFTVNFIGCILFGVVVALAEFKQIISPEIKLFLLVGFLGGLTTFSSYSYDSFFLMRHHQYFVMFLNIVVQTGFGLFGVWGGYKIIAYFFGP